MHANELNNYLEGRVNPARILSFAKSPWYEKALINVGNRNNSIPPQGYARAQHYPQGVSLTMMPGRSVSTK